MRSQAGTAAARIIGILGVVVVAIAVTVIVSRSGPNHTVRADFIDGGQLVNGDLVEVGGLQIGTITKLALTPNSLAEFTLRIDDGRFWPLRRGTIATIRPASLAGITNRYIELTIPPASAPEIPNGGVIPQTDTRPVVDLDVLLNSLTPPVRSGLQTVIQKSAVVINGAVPQANLSIDYFDPALTQLSALANQLLSDRYAFEQLISAGGSVAEQLGTHSSALTNAVGGTAATLRAVAGQTASLQDTLQRTPPVLASATGSFRRLRATLAVLDPVLRAAGPTGKPLADVVRELNAASRDVLPIVSELRATLPPLARALDGLLPVDAAGGPTLNAATQALTAALPVFTGLRPYAPDIVAGLASSIGADVAGNYDADGHFVRISEVASPGSFLDSLMSGTTPTTPPTTGNIARCPGGGVQPAADNSNPYVPDPSLCNRANDLP